MPDNATGCVTCSRIGVIFIVTVRLVLREETAGLCTCTAICLGGSVKGSRRLIVAALQAFSNGKRVSNIIT